MVGHVASNDAVGALATQVQMLGEKVEHISMSDGASNALNNLEQRIAALADALEQRAQSGGTVPPMLEALVHSLSEKIELIQQSRGDNLAAGHLEDQIVALVQRLDASDSRLGHLEAIERGLADLLVHIEDMRANKEASGLRADNSPAVDSLKHEIARTQDALEAVNGTLGHVVDRLVSIEKDIRGEGRQRPVTYGEFAEIQQPVGKVAARLVSEAPQATAPARAPAPAPAPAPVPVPPVAMAPQAPPPPAPAPKRLPPAGRLPINPDLPPDQPLEPGSGPPHLRADAATRIAAAEATLGGAGPATGKSGFIAAARRAAQAAVQAPRDRVLPPEPIETDEDEAASSLRTKVVKRFKSLFIAASIVAVVVVSIQIAGNFLGHSGPATVKSAQAPEADPGTLDMAAPDSQPEAPATAVVNPLDLPKQSGIAPLAPSTGSNVAATTSPQNFDPTPQSLPSLLSPPLLNAKNDITGSIARPAGNARPARPPAPPPPSAQTGLPITIGGANLRSAASAGYPAAAYEVAVRFAEGRGVPVSLEDAARWYERAANKGLAPAQFRYASLLEKGLGVKKDLAQARGLYVAAAAQGNGKAMHNLAVLYAEGIEGKPDYSTAALWFRKAALRGIADSQYNLGVLCARGLGTEKNLDEAYRWFALAAAQGDREAGKKRDEIAAHLDASTLAAAQQAVKSFVPEAQPDNAVTVAVPTGGWDRASAAQPPAAKSRAAAPLALGAFQVGKQ